MTTEFSGRGDPARSMALLWRTVGEPSPGRGPKRGLSVDRIVAAAIEVADTEGLAALSMRRVADQLGVGTMSLYTYVPGKAELIDLMLDTVCGEAIGDDDPTGHWRAALTRVARTNWAIYHRHPWMLQVASMSQPPMGPNVIAKYECELHAVDGIGLTDVEMDSVLSLVLVHVEGSARRSVEAAEAQRIGRTDEEWWAEYAPLLEKVLDPDRFPVASRVGQAAGEAHGAAYAPEHAFEFGLERVLDGVEALIRSRS